MLERRALAVWGSHRASHTFAVLSQLPETMRLPSGLFHPANGALYFLDPGQPRVLKETPATMQVYDLTVNESADAV